jgi:hypothetical protein
MPKLLVAVLVALALPAFAHAGDVTMRVQDLPVGTRALAAVPPKMRFNMLALHWRGPGSVAYRTHRLGGRWSAWTTADADAAPDGGTGAWHDGDLAWVGGSDGIRYRTRGRVVGLRAYELWSRVRKPVTRSLEMAGSPRIVPRSAWHANEEIVRAKPQYAPKLRLAIVHHTAGTNDYTPAQAAAIVRGIEVYHVKGNGWNDIGYNFLVDRFGNVYEGRAGGIARNVIGAHAEGFNTGSVGVALIGNYVRATPPAAQQDALVQLLAWRLDVAHVDPLAKVTLASRGNAKYRAGKLVTLREISGHRDTGPSECPGAVAYRLLPEIAKRVAATGLPKLYGPTVTGSLGGPIRFHATLTSSLAWTVNILDATGKAVASGAGAGRVVDWTWRSPPPGKSGYRWAISAPGVLAATGMIGKAGPPAEPAPAATAAVSSIVLSPSFVAPADGASAPVTLRFTLSATTRAIVQVLGPNGTVVSLEDGTLPAGANTVTFDASTLSDGRYRVVVAPRGGTSAAAELVVDRTLTGLAASAAGVSPNADGTDDTVAFGFDLSQPATVQLTIQQNGTAVATPFSGQLPAGPASIAWDGTSSAGVLLPEGAYTAVLSYTDALGSFTQSLPVSVDLTPPVLTVVDAATLQFALSEPANVTFTINGGTPIVQGEPAGAFSFPFAGTVTSFSAQPVDGAGNVGATVTG